ncbi:MAG: hypothetical protein CEE43_10860 [Promethearchaeota archaeon Loki_b32]|nr:MAG: hypothetical protein CEE43_10860 [Candidatus Lokiarchaeota archaeon Loki_b32]
MFMSSNFNFSFLLYDLFMRIFYRYIVEPTYLFKLLIIGDREVGRRTFLRESIDDNFFVEDYIETVGVDIYRKELIVEEGVIDLMIWNVSTKETFGTLLTSYINTSDGVLLMFDITNLSTLYFLSKYPQLIREKAGEIPILLVGNKLDLKWKREVYVEEGAAFARGNDLLDYIEVSAKTGKDCEKILEVLVENILVQF